MSTDHFPDILSQQIFVGIILVRRLGVACVARVPAPFQPPAPEIERDGRSQTRFRPTCTPMHPCTHTSTRAPVRPFVRQSLRPCVRPCVRPSVRPSVRPCVHTHTFRHRLNGYLVHRVPSLFLASSFRTCLNCEVLKGMFPWRTRHPLSQAPIKPAPNADVAAWSRRARRGARRSKPSLQPQGDPFSQPLTVHDN